jgi:predicted AAA+ superfamily ATPase
MSSYKIYLFDTGLYNALRPKGLLDEREEIAGPGLEGLVLQHLKAWNDYNSQKNNLCFWRTRSGVEVDFIVYGEREFFAIEVKNSKNINLQDTKALKTFLQDYPEAKSILLYRGKEKIMCNGIFCMPVEQFLINLKPEKNLATVVGL